MLPLSIFTNPRECLRFLLQNETTLVGETGKKHGPGQPTLVVPA